MAHREDITRGLASCFYSGIKKDKLIGAEFEHFIVNRTTLRTYNYYEEYGIESILNALLQYGWESNTLEGPLLSLTKGYGIITLEPAGQLELSIMPQSTIDELDLIYKSFVKDIKMVLEKDQALVSCGYHPHSKIEELEFIPKPRYNYMSSYFKTTGRYAHNMMKGTASTQVGIDFSSEDDFGRKYRLFCALSPFITAFFDSTGVFEGSPTIGHAMRSQIWKETDPDRSGVPIDAFDKNFGFEGYANYVANTPPILMLDGSTTYFTGGELAEKFWDALVFDKKQYEHLLTMVFPDVRLKNFIEIRMADALPYPFNFAVIELINALAYDSILFEEYASWAEKMTYREYESLRESVIEFGLSTNYNMGTIFDFMLEISNRIIDSTMPSKSLEAYVEWIKQQGMTIAEKLKNASHGDVLTYIEVII